MSTNSQLRIAGVPEAFNDAFFETDFEKSGVTPAPEFVSAPGGSGAMLRLLEGGEVDAAFMLTDAVIAAIENGHPVRIASPLVVSSLRWGVTVKPGRNICLEDLHDATWGISRLGSGSHVMVRVLASERGWPIPKFVPCGDFTGLRNAVNQGDIDAFLWEHFTTKPFADAQKVSIIDDVPTPWGCFVVAVRENCSNVSEIRNITDSFLNTAKEYIRGGFHVRAIAEKHGMIETDAREWAESVEYSSPGQYRLAEKELNLVRNALLSAGVISDQDKERENKVAWYMVDFTKN